MQAQNYLQNLRCQCQGNHICTCPQREESATLFLENINDIAATLVKVMIACGIEKCRAALAPDIIVYSFLKYDEIIYGVETCPKKSIHRDDLIYKLAVDCNMSKMEAHLAYSIIKRAFKAFYHGTMRGGIRNPLLEAKMFHNQECMWVHAAKRTAEIFSEYEGMFYSARIEYEKRFMCLYKHLFDRMKKRSDLASGDVCTCHRCIDKSNFQYAVPMNTLSTAFPVSKACRLLLCDHDKGMQYEKAEEEEQKKIEEAANVTVQKTVSQETLNLPRCYKCNCPKLICECDVDPVTGVIAGDCGQGPFSCKWFRVKNNDQFDLSNRFDKPENHQCPVDCRGETISISCDSICECDCDVCTCDVISIETESVEEEEEEEESIISESIEVESEESFEVFQFPHRKEYGRCRVGPPGPDESDSDEDDDESLLDADGKHLQRHLHSMTSTDLLHDGGSLESLLKLGATGISEETKRIKKYQNFYMHIWDDPRPKLKKRSFKSSTLDSLLGGQRQTATSQNN